jgi:osmotically-inducible protein OsmY
MFNFFDKNDNDIQKDVMEEMSYDPSVNSKDLNASSENGIVILRGTVQHLYEKTAAVEAAQRVGGVKGVADEIELRLTDDYLKSDEEIAEAAYRVLVWNYQVPKEIKLSVEKGWVTLTGVTDWDYQRLAAKEAIRSLTGVKGITNKITLLKKADFVDIERNIKSALSRTAETEGKKIEVLVEGGKVTLTGKAHSFSEMEDVRLATWNSAGVSQVVNNIELSK